MQERKVGRSDLRLSSIGLGCNNIGNRTDFETSRRIVHKALDLGITLFDTADIYGVRGYSGRGGGETELGQILGSRRKDILLATKFGMPMSDDGSKQGGSRAYVMSAVEGSLRRLDTDWIDIYQMHVPDSKTPIEETLRALDDLVREGKVRYIACSNFPAWQIVEGCWTSQVNELSGFVLCESEYSLLNRKVEAELIPALSAYDMGMIAFQPLAGGLLTGKYRRDRPLPAGARLSNAGPEDGRAGRTLTERNWAITEQLMAFVEKRNRTMTELAFGWLLHQDAVSCVITGASTPEQLEQNVGSTGWVLSTDDLKEIDRITKDA